MNFGKIFDEFLHSHIIIFLFILDILFKKFAKNEFLYSIKNNSPYGIKKQKNTSTWDFLNYSCHMVGCDEEIQSINHILGRSRV